MGKHPFPDYTIRNPKDLPTFSLTDMRDMLGPEEHWENRDTVKGFGNDLGTVRIAELLLNASRPEDAQDEYELEGELGFRGVAPGSAEVHLWLPGSIAWEWDEAQEHF